MNIIESKPLTTKQAAGLLLVHESSIKRWCKEGTLNFEITEGGHRRIMLEELLQFADERGHRCSLLSFPEDVHGIWQGLQTAQSRKDFDILFQKAYEWLKTPSPGIFGHLIDFCLEQGLPFSEVFDGIIARSLRQIGTDWQDRKLDVGTEHFMTEIVRDTVQTIRRRFITKHPINNQTESHKPPHNLPENKQRALIGCNEGNHHDIGAQAVRTILEECGWDTIYLGANVPVNDFAKLQARHNASLVCISFVSSNVMFDAARCLEILDKYYSAQSPFHLALGGCLFPEDAVGQLPSTPFESLNIYRTTLAFNHWLNGQRIQ